MVDPIHVNVFFGEGVFDGAADEAGVFEYGGDHSFGCFGASGGLLAKHDCL